MRRTTCQLFALTSRISLDLLHATKIEEPSADGSAHVGEHELSPGFGASIPCPPVSFMPGMCVWFFVKLSLRLTFNARVSISTRVSSIMHAEYCFVPCGFKREPCGIVQVCIRATSVIVCVDTTDTDDGTMSPCRLKLTTKRKLPSGVMSRVAGK